MRRAALVCGAAGIACAAAGIGWAEGARLTPEAFEALSAGRTLYFTDDAGEPRGAEQYLPDRGAIWQTPDGSCLRGRWRAEAGDVCFSYDDRPEVWTCWEVGRDDRGVFARLRGAGPGGDLVVSGESNRPLVCDGLDRPV